MKKKKFPYLLSIFLPLILFCLSLPLHGQSSPNQKSKIIVGLEHKKFLGKKVPLDTEFVNEDGKKISLKEIVDRPVILTLVYFNCPGICTPLLNSLRYTLEKLELEPGIDFKVVTISFDPREDHRMATEKRKSYLGQMKRPFPKDAWRFLTGEKKNIDRICDAVGFRFEKEGKEYRHSGTVIVLSPQGKITRYLLGLSYNPIILQMALKNASSGRVEPTIAKLIRLCFSSYDQKARLYKVNIVNIGMAIIFLAVMVFALVLVFQSSKSKKKGGEEDNVSSSN